MKVLNSVCLLILVAVGARAGNAQGVPEAPIPAPLSDPAWIRVERIANGTPIVVSSVEGNTLHCLFAGATYAYLDCSPPGNPAGTGYRIEHADVVGVDFEFRANSSTQVPRHERNYHPAWISSMIAGGFIVGMIASQNTSAGRGAEDGIIGAGIVGIIGAPLAFFPHARIAPPTPVYSGYGFGDPLRSPKRLRSL
jgi:hypothetical protein